MARPGAAAMWFATPRQAWEAIVMAHPPPLRVNRAPVLTLWASIVAERLGHAPETALSLASAIAGTAAHAKARRLGLEERREAGEEGKRKPQARVPHDTVRLLGREIPVTDGKDGPVLAVDADGKAAPPGPVRAYVSRAFGDQLGNVRTAMEALACSVEPEELDRTGFRLYESFRPDVPEGARGWGAKGELHLDRIRAAAR